MIVEGNCEATGRKILDCKIALRWFQTPTGQQFGEILWIKYPGEKRVWMIIFESIFQRSTSRVFHLSEKNSTFLKTQNEELFKRLKSLPNAS